MTHVKRRERSIVGKGIARERDAEREREREGEGERAIGDFSAIAWPLSHHLKRGNCKLVTLANIVCSTAGCRQAT